LGVQAVNCSRIPSTTLLRLRPFGTPKTSVGPDALGVSGPCFATRETSENLQMISQRRKRLAFAPAASDVSFSDCVKRPSALALERRLRCDPSHAGVMPYGRAESWLPRLSATPYPPARRLRRLDSLALCCDDVRTFSPEHASVKLNSFAGPNARSRGRRLQLIFFAGPLPRCTALRRAGRTSFSSPTSTSLSITAFFRRPRNTAERVGEGLSSAQVLCLGAGGAHPTYRAVRVDGRRNPALVRSSRNPVFRCRVH
jgi:hypothetical protein